MARDEALLMRVGTHESPPTLRLYQWEPPTISLGYFQRYADFETLPSPLGGLAVVRRTTGGGAILHDLELTYSLTLPAEHELLARGVQRLYELAHDAIIASLKSLHVDSARDGESDGSGAARGPFFCFERRHRFDVLTGREKVAGSAQRRTRNAVLQHGSIILADRFGRQTAARVPHDFETAVGMLRGRLVDDLARLAGVALRPGDWSPDELVMAANLIDKYTGPAWTRRT